MFCNNCEYKNLEESNYCKKCGTILTPPQSPFLYSQEWFRKYRKRLLIGLGIFFFIAIIGSSDNSVNQSETAKSYDQNQVTASVVNIFCPSYVSEEESTGGSGTIISEDGLILTNSHIIPQDEKNIHVDEDGCMVVLPNPSTGQGESFYLARPIVLPDISEKYDIAYLSIYDAYYDEEKQEYAGVFPTKFPAFDDTDRCIEENIKLGETVRIFGYPAVSGGYSLTLTDGIVSSFSDDGLIYTSAKISNGNSGGLAVDEGGCMIGIPSFVSTDENTSLGIIIPPNLINEFTQEVDNLLKD